MLNNFLRFLSFTRRQVDSRVTLNDLELFMNVVFILLFRPFSNFKLVSTSRMEWNRFGDENYEADRIKERIDNGSRTGREY